MRTCMNCGYHLNIADGICTKCGEPTKRNMREAITIEVNEEERAMLASLFNTATIADMNADGMFEHVHPAVNPRCNWSELCVRLARQFNYEHNIHKYPQAIHDALKARLRKSH